MPDTQVPPRPLLIYLHGFLSSPESSKCQQLRDWLARERPDIVFYAPLISPHPAIAAESLTLSLQQFLNTEHRGQIGLVGSSMGGFWANFLAERHQLPAVVVNPAVRPARFLPEYIGRTLYAYSGEQRQYQLTEHDVASMSDLESHLSASVGRYWLLAQRGDETLDCREAEQFYCGQRQTVENGGDHSFQGFARYCAPLVDFLFESKRNP
ncbi:MAG: hypothetical protein K0U59_02100 [Gammaproteobacteria bacterium]|nr:hypothetical protein [Gammaproteobacteria bacterium]